MESPTPADPVPPVEAATTEGTDEETATLGTPQRWNHSGDRPERNEVALLRGRTSPLFTLLSQNKPVWPKSLAAISSRPLPILLLSAELQRRVLLGPTHAPPGGRRWRKTFRLLCGSWTANSSRHYVVFVLRGFTRGPV